MTKKLMLIAALTFTMSIAALAQTNLAGADLKVTIPFAFYAGDQQLPAGLYSVRNDAAHKVVILRSDRTPGVFILANRLESLDPVGQSQLKFSRFGADYFLDQVWIGGRSDGQQIRSGKLREELAAKGKPVEMVMVQPHSR